MASAEDKKLSHILFKEPFLAALKALKLLKGFFLLIIFYLIIMEMTLLICGYSFNFNLLSKEQFKCRREVKNCLNTYIYYGVNDGKGCGSECMDSLMVTLEGYHENNFFTRLIDKNLQ